MKFDKSNLIGIIALLGAILTIVGVFLTWLDADLLYAIGKSSESYSGWDVYSNDDGIFDDFDYGYAPLVALITGILALITSIVPMFYTNDKLWKCLGAITLILGIVTIVLGFLFNGDIPDSAVASFGGISVGIEYSAGAGLWVTIAGSILLVLGGIADIVKKNA